MRIKVKAIIPRELLGDPARIERAVNNALDATSLAMKVDFDVTTRTWRNRPEFFIRRPAPGVRIIFTENKIYRFVSGGTRIRYATMTVGFKPKTFVRQIFSGPGRGGLAYVNTRKPRPGIKAREFPEVIVKKWESGRLAKTFQRAIDAEAV
jgi:hypothetical protein